MIVPCLVNLAALLSRLNRVWRTLVWSECIAPEVRPRSRPSSVLPFLATSGSIVALHLGEQVGDVERLEEEVHLAGLDLGEVEDVVDQAEQVLAGAADLLEVGDEARPGRAPRPPRCSISL